MMVFVNVARLLSLKLDVVFYHTYKWCNYNH